MGGSGDDTLSGGGGSNLLIGSAGADSVSGSGGSDLLVGGTTDFDGNLAALLSVMAEWGRTDLGYADRILHLTGEVPGGLNGAVVINWQNFIDDGVEDLLWGDAGLDWFFAFDVINEILDQEPGERNN